MALILKVRDENEMEVMHVDFDAAIMPSAASCLYCLWLFAYFVEYHSIPKPIC